MVNLFIALVFSGLICRASQAASGVQPVKWIDGRVEPGLHDARLSARDLQQRAVR